MLSLKGSAMADVQTPAKTWMYHPTEAPTGQLFDTAHAPSGDGWVDTPAKFAAPADAPDTDDPPAEHAPAKKVRKAKA
jgi:hypothetical protein